jgi:heme/copper-type cytochrome/quinol oxidase subunit 3
MIRPVLTELALFLTPFVIYAIYLAATRNGVWKPASWPPRRLAALAIVSLILMLGSFVILAHFSGARPGSTYIPAHIENGRFVPGTTQ